MHKDDLAEIFDVEEHGDYVEFFGQSFVGIFDNLYLDQDAGVVDVESSTPVLLTETINVREAKKGDGIKVNGIGYFIAEPARHDFTGVTTLILKEHA